MSQEEKQEVSLGTIYDINKQLMMQEPILTKEEVKEKLKIVEKYFANKEDSYFMLLCHEKRNYTILHLNYAKIAISNTDFNASKELGVCLFNRGYVQSIHLNDDDVIEIWLKDFDEEDVCCYFLFPYDLGVVEVE